MFKNTAPLACRDRKDLPLKLVELKAEQKGDVFTFEGYGSVWNRVDSYGDTILKGAFLDSLKERHPMMLYGHAMNRIPGKWIDVDEDDKGLFMRGELTPGHSEAKDLEASLKHGAISGLSIGGYAREAKWREEDGEFVGRDISKFDLYETSVVGMPAETEARIDPQSLKAALLECGTIREVELMLREQHGFSRQAADALVSRVRALTLGVPADGGSTKGAAEFATSIRSLSIPTSLLAR